MQDFRRAIYWLGNGRVLFIEHNAYPSYSSGAVTAAMLHDFSIGAWAIFGQRLSLCYGS